VPKVIKFAVPGPENSPFLFKKALIESIRRAISQAHVDGDLDVQTTVNCLKSLPVPEPRP
jgi:hypothetical protein